MNPKVYIILLNFNCWRDTLECLESIIENNYHNYQVVIVDNNSIDDSISELINVFTERKLSFIKYSKKESENRELILSKESKDKLNGKRLPVIFIQHDINSGFSAGNNTGMKYALLKNDADYFWLLNNDTVIHNDSLTELVRLAEKDKKNGIIGSKLLFYFDRGIIQSLGNDSITWKGIGNGYYDGVQDNAELNGIIETRSIIGASMLIKKEVIEKAGFLDENFFMYHEESDLSMMASRYGYKLLISCKSIIFHKEGWSTGKKELLNLFWEEKRAGQLLLIF